jgi:hypothetical protein
MKYLVGREKTIMVLGRMLPVSGPHARADTPMRQTAGVTLFDAFDPPLPELDSRASTDAPIETEETAPVNAMPEVEVRTSARRRKTSEAKWVGGRIIVTIPAHLTGESREKTISWLVDRLIAKHPLRTAVGDNDLMERALHLSEKYQMGVRPASVRWVTNQSARWGSCSFHSAEIRISHRLRAVPPWVLDAVLVHELAHLRHPDHSPAFHQLANVFPRHAEAGVFLAGYGLGLAAPSL